MELDKANEQRTPAQTTPQEPVANLSIPSQRGFVPVIIGVIVLLIIVAGGAYYLGTKSINNNQYQTNQPSASSTTPVPTNYNQSSISIPSSPQPKDNLNWQTYSNEKFSYSVKYPTNLEISQMDLQNAPYSAIFNIKQSEPGPSGFPVLYVSVIPNGFTNTNSVVYNFMSDDLVNSFFPMNVGEVKQTQTGTYSEFWTYKKLPNTTIAGQSGITIENDKVWEGGDGLKDRRVFVKKNNSTYMIGVYYRTSQELADFQRFMENFSFTK